MQPPFPMQGLDPNELGSDDDDDDDLVRESDAIRSCAEAPLAGVTTPHHARGHTTG